MVKKDDTYVYNKKKRQITFYCGYGDEGQAIKNAIHDLAEKHKTPLYKLILEALRAYYKIKL